MTDKQKEAIKFLYNLRATIDESIMLFDEDINVKCGKETIKQITTVLNLIQTQQAEIETKDKQIEQYQNMLATNDMLHVLECEKKDKMIDLMIKVMIDSGICDYFIKQNCKHYAGENKKLCDVCIKEYFERKSENGR